jgi:hypothetical protein
VYIVREFVACLGLEVREHASSGQIAFGPGRAYAAVAFIQVACSVYQGNTSRFLGYISKAIMLLVSESGASTRKQDKRGKDFILDL